MAYLPIARKYRPKTFDELIGQPHVTATLGRAIDSGRIGQAYLFTGQRGVGKTSAARILAKSLNCAKGPTPKPCQQCPSCQSIQQGNSLDVIEIDGASNRGIDDVRQLREQVKFAPVAGRFKVYIIDEVHQITTDAFNALLKTLEEPPAHVKFIFATTAPQKVPATILSRCQRFDFRRIEAKTLVATLKRIAKSETISLNEPALYAIARASEGSVRDAEVMLEQLASFCEGPIAERDVTQLLGALEQDVLLAWVQAILDRDAGKALAMLAEQIDHGKEIAQLVIGLTTHLRHLLMLRATAQTPAGTRQGLVEQLLDIPAEDITKLDAQATQVESDELIVMLQLLAGAYELIRRSPFAQAILEMTVMKLTTRESMASLEEMIQRLERLSSHTPAQDSAAPLTPARTASGSRPATIPSGSGVSPQPAALPPLSPQTSSRLQPSPKASATHVEPIAEAATSTMEAEPDAETSLELVSQQWPQILDRIGKQKMSLAAYLMDARPMSVTGQQLLLGLPGFALHHEVLGLVENIRLVERTLAELITRPLKVHYTVLPDPLPGTIASRATPPLPEHEPTPPIVQDIVQLFDATIVKPPLPQS